MNERGFTLLEVMVAVAIMGLSLTVILSSQAGLFSGASHAEHTSQAIGLARCRMTELEEHLLKFGYPLDDEKDEGECCEDETIGGMRCSWRIDTVELPEAKPPSLDSAGGLNLGSSAAKALGTSSPGSPDQALGPLSTLSRMATSPQSLVGDGGVSGFASSLQESTGGVDGIAQMVMTFVYPKLKPLLEASIRKLTVTVTWHEGIKSRDLTITQYVTHPTRPDLLFPAASGSATSPASPVNPTTPVTPATGIRR